MCAKRLVGCLALLLGLLLAACQPLAAAAPAPLQTVQLIQAQVTPALGSLAVTFSQCTRQVPGVGFAWLEVPAPSLDMQTGGLIIRWGAPTSVPGYAALLGYERLIFVANPSNPLERISRDDLQALYSGLPLTWKKFLPPQCSACQAETGGNPFADQEIHAWAYSPGEDIQEIFETALGKALKTGTTFQAPGPQALREAVASDPAAIGFVPARYFDNSVKEIVVEDVSAAGLRQPVLALTPTEPQGALRQWLGCVQAGLKEPGQ